MITVDFWRNRLGRKIVMLMIAVSALFSVGAAGIQLYLSYERDRARAFSAFDIIETSFRDGLERALWEFNFRQVEALLNGIFTQQDIVYLKLDAETGQSWQRGSAAPPELTLREFTLSYQGQTNAPSPVGVLTAGLSLEFVRTRIWTQFRELVLTNFIKTMLASVAMLFIFDRLAARHLRSIAMQSGQEWLDTDDGVVIDRPRKGLPNELDDIVQSLNHARDRVRGAHDQLSIRLEELARLNEKLADANREQAEFTYAISHDLKSPTNTVRMLLRELRHETRDSRNDDSTEIFDDLETTVARMGQLVEDVLAYSRSVGENMTVEPVDLNEEVQAILQDLSGDIAAAGAQVELGTLPVVAGSRMQLRILMQNLISNAVKFRDPSRAAVIRIDSEPEQPGCVAVHVHDNGIGIDPEFHAQIFGLFKRLHAHGTYPGSGIGLTVCQRIVSNHNGSIEVSSKSGEGSTFTIVLPEDRA